MKAEPQAHGVKGASDDQFGMGVLAAYARHQRGTLPTREAVSHGLGWTISRRPGTGECPRRVPKNVNDRAFRHAVFACQVFNGRTGISAFADLARFRRS
jgi:hypothetical protein